MTTRTGKPSKLTNLARLALYDWDLEIIDVLARLADKFRAIKVIDFNSKQTIKNLSLRITFGDLNRIIRFLNQQGFSKQMVGGVPCHCTNCECFGLRYNDKVYVVSLTVQQGVKENNFIITKNLLTG